MWRSCSGRSLPSRRRGGSPLVAIPVDLASPGEVTKIKAGMKDAKDDAPLAAPAQGNKASGGEGEGGQGRAGKDRLFRRKRPRRPRSRKKRRQSRKRSRPRPPLKKQQRISQPAQAKAAPPVPKPKPAPPPRSKRPTPTGSPRCSTSSRTRSRSRSRKNLAEETKPVRGQSTAGEVTMSVNEIDALRARIAAMLEPAPRRSRRRSRSW